MEAYELVYLHISGFQVAATVVLLSIFIDNSMSYSVRNHISRSVRHYLFLNVYSQVYDLGLQFAPCQLGTGVHYLLATLVL